MPESSPKDQFEALFVLNRDKIYRFAYKLVGDTARAEEITQQCFIKLWENMHKVQPGQDVFPLLFVFVKHIAIDETRRAYREKKHQQSMIINRQIALEDESTEQAILYKELREEMHKLIERLPEQRRNIYLLSRQEGQSHKEIATQLSLSPLTVRNHLQLAIQFIKRGLTSRYHVEPK